MLSKEENELLCRIEGNAPIGEIMRRHWQPACLSEELFEPDGEPLKVRLCGIDLVAFRDTNGRIGILDELCPHRRASLTLGRNEECGLRCLYHGWKFDVDGNAVELASEPSETSLSDKVRAKSYPAREAAGFIWVYLGPPDCMPDFEPPAFQPSLDTRISIAKYKVPCNWAQVLEGGIDSAHSSSLHSSDMVPAKVESAESNEHNWLRPSTDRSPRLQAQRTPFGFRYAAIRRPLKNAQTCDYIRTTIFIAPHTVCIPPNNNYSLAILHVPIDDQNTYFYFVAFGNAATTPDTQTWRKFLRAMPGIDLNLDWTSKRTVENKFMQDREAMKAGSYTGIDGFPNQDYAMWVTMGPITDRTREKLGASDLAIVEFRRLMLDAAKDYLKDGSVIGLGEPRIPQNMLRSFEGVVSKSADWRLLGLTKEEILLRGLDGSGVSVVS